MSTSSATNPYMPTNSKHIIIIIIFLVSLLSFAFYFWFIHMGTVTPLGGGLMQQQEAAMTGGIRWEDRENQQATTDSGNWASSSTPGKESYHPGSGHDQQFPTTQHQHSSETQKPTFQQHDDSHSMDSSSSSDSLTNRPTTPKNTDWVKYEQVHSPRKLPYIPITINDEHNDVLFFWTLFNITNMNLLHIDSHSDGFLPSSGRLFPTKDQMTGMSKSDFLEVILRETNIGDYIPVAQYYGQVGGKVIWISSAWDDVKDYNLVHGVQYFATLKRDANNLHFCQCCTSESESTPHSLDDFMHENTEQCKKDDSQLDWKMPIQWDVTDIQHAKERILSTWGSTEKLHSSSNSDTSGGDVDSSEETGTLDAPSNHSPQIHTDNSTGSTPVHIDPYIIDLDLDYFAASEPTIYQFIPDFHPLGTILAVLKRALSNNYFCISSDDRLSGRARDIEETLAEWINEWINPIFSNYDIAGGSPSHVMQDEPSLKLEYDPKRDSKILSLMCPHISESVLFSDSSQSNTAAKSDVHNHRSPSESLDESNNDDKEEAAPGSTQSDHKKMEHIVHLKSILLHFFSTANYLQSYLLFHHHEFFSFGCETNFLFGVCNNGDPSHYPSRSHIIKRIDQLRNLIRDIGREPDMISIARSLDGYCPKHLHAFIENELLKRMGDFSKPTKFFYKPQMAPPRTPPFKEDNQDFSNPTEEQLDEVRKDILELLHNPQRQHDAIEEIHEKRRILRLMAKIQKQNGMEVDRFVRSFPKFLKIKKKFWEREGFPWKNVLHAKLDNDAKRTILDIKRRLDISEGRNDAIDFDSIVKEYNNM